MIYILLVLSWLQRHAALLCWIAVVLVALLLGNATWQSCHGPPIPPPLQKTIDSLVATKPDADQAVATAMQDAARHAALAAHETQLRKIAESRIAIQRAAADSLFAIVTAMSSSTTVLDSIGAGWKATALAYRETADSLGTVLRRAESRITDDSIQLTDVRRAFSIVAKRDSLSESVVIPGLQKAIVRAIECRVLFFRCLSMKEVAVASAVLGTGFGYVVAKKITSP